MSTKHPKKNLIESLIHSQKKTVQNGEPIEESKTVEKLQQIFNGLLNNANSYFQVRGEQVIKEEASFGKSFQKFSENEVKEEKKASATGSETNDSAQPPQPANISSSGSGASNSLAVSGSGMPPATNTPNPASGPPPTTPSSANPPSTTPDNSSAGGNPSLEKSASAESGFLMAMGKFAEVSKSIVDVKREFINEATQKFLQPLTAFIKVDLAARKDFKKRYKKAVEEYNQILAKIESLQSHKKLDIVKLYNAEKERVKLKKNLDEATEALQTYCDDIQDRLGFDFLEWMVALLRAQKTMFGFVFGELQEIKEYLDELHAWCKEEAFIFAEQKKEREQVQTQTLEAEHLEHVKQFLKLMDADVLEAVRTVATQKGVVVLPSLAALYTHYHVSPVPEGLPAPTPSTTPDSDLQNVREFFKANFNAIGITLLAKNKRDHLIELGDALCQLEKVTPHTEDKE
jgi:hypothetical protein